MEGAAQMTLANLLSAVGDILTAAVGWVGDLATAITSNPLILLFVILSVVGFGVHMLKMLISA